MFPSADFGWCFWLQLFLLTKVILATICPTDRLSWEERARNFTCDTENNVVYHCILDDTGQLVETCVNRITVSKGKVGCPGIAFINGEAHHEDVNTRCPSENKNCPSGNSDYFSDQLYIYPICFLNQSERSSYDQTTKKRCEMCVYLTEKTTLNQKDGSKSSKDIGLIVAVSLLTALSLCLVLCLMYMYRCYVKLKKKEKIDSGKSIRRPLNGGNIV